MNGLRDGGLKSSGRVYRLRFDDLDHREDDSCNRGGHDCVEVRAIMLRKFFRSSFEKTWDILKRRAEAGKGQEIEGRITCGGILCVNPCDGLAWELALPGR